MVACLFACSLLRCGQVLLVCLLSHFWVADRIGLRICSLLGWVETDLFVCLLVCVLV